MIGAIIMVHGDDDGLVLPPKISPIQVVILPIAMHKEGVLEKAQELKETLQKNFRVKLDDSDHAPGWKFAEYEMKGVPVRVEIGPKDIEKGQCVVVRRDTREKIFTPIEELTETIEKTLQDIHNAMYEKALKNM
jgi:prolyl-tRNA synthetase